MSFRIYAFLIIYLRINETRNHCRHRLRSKFSSSREIFRGVTEHVRESNLNWRLVPPQFGFEPPLMQLAQSGQLSGAIGTFISDEWVAGLHQHGVQAVNLFSFSEINSIPSVCLEDFKIGEQAAQHLREQGASTLCLLRIRQHSLQ